MKTFKRILLVLALIIVVFLGVVAVQPAIYRVSRTANIGAPPSAVFPLVNNFRNWEAWSPWAKLDPGVKYTYEGPAEGPGAIVSWSGDQRVGEGRMTVLESRSNELIRINLEFIKPFPSSCATEFFFKPDANGTAVTWTMTGQKNFVEKGVCLFMNMDKMVGGDFERGLGLMRAAVEAKGKPSSVSAH